MKAIVLAVVAGAATAASAAVTPMGPFTGTLQESWESFQNYWNDPDFYMDNPTIMMGGAAQIAHPVMVVYEPSAGPTFGLSSWGSAQVVDGTKGHGVDTGYPPTTATITFNTPVVEFGGWWGAAGDGVNPTPIVFDFYDAGGGLIDTVTVGYSDYSFTGTLMWAGWQSGTPIARIDYTGDYVVNDYLQANVPAPATLGLLGLGGFVATRRRR